MGPPSLSLTSMEERKFVLSESDEDRIFHASGSDEEQGADERAPPRASPTPPPQPLLHKDLAPKHGGLNPLRMAQREVTSNYILPNIPFPSPLSRPSRPCPTL